MGGLCHGLQLVVAPQGHLRLPDAITKVSQPAGDDGITQGAYAPAESVMRPALVELHQRQRLEPLHLHVTGRREAPPSEMA